MSSQLNPTSHSLMSWLLAGIVLTALTWIYLDQGQGAVRAPKSTDFYKFYLSGTRLQAEQSMYWLPTSGLTQQAPCDTTASEQQQATIERLTLSEPDTGLHPNLNPPIFAIIALPISLLSYEVAWWTWSCASIFCAIFSLKIIFNMLNPGLSLTKPAFTWSCLGLLSYYPFFANFIFGQVGTFLLLLLALSWRAMRRGNLVSAGVWLGLATSFKPFFGLFLIAFIAGRIPRAAVGLLLTTAACTASSWLTLGSDIFHEYWLITQEITWTASNWNASLTGFFTRLFGGSENTPWIYSRHLGLGCIFFSTIFFVALTWRSIRTLPWHDRPHHHLSDTIFLIVPPTMLLLSPLGWLYYFPLLTIGALILWQRLTASYSNTYLKWPFICAVGISYIPRPFATSDGMNAPIDWWIHGPLNFYILLTMCLLSHWCATDKTRQSNH